MGKIVGWQLGGGQALLALQEDSLNGRVLVLVLRNGRVLLL